MTWSLGLIGGGNMAEAIVGAVIGSRIFPAHGMIVSDTAPQRLEIFKKLGTAVTTRNEDVVAGASTILLAVKPQKLHEIASALAGVKSEAQLVISIMAGQSTAKIESLIGSKARVIRVMPNTPLLVGKGFSAITRGAHATEADETLAVGLFSAAGQTVVVDENLMDAVTALSGSGPAYLFYLAQAMTEAGVSLGLDPALADRMTRSVISGAAAMMEQAPLTPPADLRRKVTSPGGTTEAAITHMDEARLKEILIESIRKAAQRSQELGK